MTVDMVDSLVSWSELEPANYSSKLSLFELKDSTCIVSWFLVNLIYPPICLNLIHITDGKTLTKKNSQSYDEMNCI